ncbi:hypothetical protein TSMG0053 [Halocynthia phage JM-2012]|uniref:tail fiber protein n=1 Tax=Halocynthia phage JM-2012 TaxID=1173297 RepID=UPI00025C6909|nr:tail fiber protein [Halocynthia phage JM-2012]AFI55336.1 hypothetical protein TSMG0053 [Halocynthia phage JM-2012]
MNDINVDLVLLESQRHASRVEELTQEVGGKMVEIDKAKDDAIDEFNSKREEFEQATTTSINEFKTNQESKLGEIETEHSAKLDELEAAKQSIPTEVVNQWEADKPEFRQTLVTEAVQATADNASRAESALDSIILTGIIYTTVSEGVTNTSNGEFFKVISTSVDIYIDIYLNIGDGNSELIKTYPSTASIEYIKSDILKLANDLTDKGLLDYLGDGTVVPIITDKNLNILLGYNKQTQELIGAGLNKQRNGEELIVNYLGTEVVPILTDVTGKVLLGYDVKSEVIIGAGIVAKNISGNGYTSTTEPLPYKINSYTLNHIVIYGQSLSIGAKAVPIISSIQPYNVKTFAGGPRAYDGSNQLFLPLKDLIEDDIFSPDGKDGRGETPCAGFGNYLSTLRAMAGDDLSTRPLLLSAAGHGGYSISELEKDTTWYNDYFLEHIRQGNAITNDYYMGLVYYIQGETDIDDGVSKSFYSGKFGTMIDDINVAANTISGKSDTTYILTYQLSYGCKLSDAVYSTQQDYHDTHDLVYITTPTYILPHGPDGTHLTNVGSKLLGAYGAKSYNQMLNGNKPKCLKVKSVTLRGTVLNCTFDVPVPPLQLNTDDLAMTLDYGFVVTVDDVPVDILSINITSYDTVTLKLNSEPSGVVKLRYALDNIATDVFIKDGASGNLTDSNSETITLLNETYTLVNPCTHFTKTAIKLGE